MGSKRKLIVCIILVAMFFMLLGVILYGVKQNKEDYCSKLVSVMNAQETVTVYDVFSFTFDHAYVFNDCYISGEGFAERYNLDVSINRVKSGVSENIQRIVFVDESGAFVYEFKCDHSQVVWPKDGVIIYPQTLITRESSTQEKPLIISFQSFEHYNS